jgi:hypothetical protein
VLVLVLVLVLEEWRRLVFPLGACQSTLISRRFQ